MICDMIGERSSLKERLSPATRQAVRNTLLLLLEVFKRETGSVDRGVEFRALCHVFDPRTSELVTVASAGEERMDTTISIPLNTRRRKSWWIVSEWLPRDPLKQAGNTAAAAIGHILRHNLPWR